MSPARPPADLDGYDPADFDPRALADAPPADADGYDLRPDPLQAATAAEFTAALRRYRAWAGDPPFRQIAHRADGGAAASTIWQALNDDTGTLPRLAVVIAIIAGCGGTDDDQRRYATAWRRLRLELYGDTPAA